MTSRTTTFKPPTRPQSTDGTSATLSTMHSMFLPGQPLPDLDDVQESALYHLLLNDGSIGTVQRHGDLWNWRKLTAGNSRKGTRAELETWLKQETAHPEN